MDKKMMFVGLGLLAAAGLAYYFLVGRASAEELNYVRQLSNADLLGILDAASMGTGYLSLNEQQVKSLVVAAEQEAKARGIFGASMAFKTYKQAIVPGPAITASSKAAMKRVPVVSKYTPNRLVK